MALTLDQLRETLQKPLNREALAQAVRHEDRVRFHTEAYMSLSDISRTATVFLNWVKTQLPPDKYKIFLTLFTFPVQTIELTGTVFKELSQVLHAANPVYQYRFADASYLEDWDEYRKESLGYPAYWRSQGWKAFKTAINSVLVVDVPTEQVGIRPSAYAYLLDIRNVLDYKLNADGGMEYLLFTESEGVAVLIDDEKYMTLAVDGTEVKEVRAESPHGLGYCPATFFWHEDLNSRSKGVKASPISRELANLDWLLTFQTNKRHLDLYAPYPIYSGYEADCDFENNDAGSYCDGGYLRGEGDRYIVYNDGTLAPCPVCIEKRIVGPGAFIEVPAPQRKEDPDLRNPISVVPADIASLDYNVKEANRLRAQIYESCVGEGGEAIGREAVNEMQVKASFQSKDAVLAGIKVGFEKAQKFAEDTICRLRYGDAFLGSSISWGTEFFNLTADDLYAKYRQAKEAGAPTAELDAISDRIIRTQYRNNPDMMRRQQVLARLEPYRHYTMQELLQLKQVGSVNEELFLIKVNFSRYVSRFEDENTDIVEFGALTSADQKYKIITDKFKEYVIEETNSA